MTTEHTKSREEIKRLAYDYAMTIMSGKPDGKILKVITDQAARVAGLEGVLMLIQAKASINLPSNYYKTDTEIKDDILKTVNKALKEKM